MESNYFIFVLELVGDWPIWVTWALVKTNCKQYRKRLVRKWIAHIFRKAKCCFLSCTNKFNNNLFFKTGFSLVIEQVWQFNLAFLFCSWEVAKPLHLCRILILPKFTGRKSFIVDLKNDTLSEGKGSKIWLGTYPQWFKFNPISSHNLSFWRSTMYFMDFAWLEGIKIFRVYRCLSDFICKRWKCSKSVTNIYQALCGGWGWGRWLNIFILSGEHFIYLLLHSHLEEVPWMWDEIKEIPTFVWENCLTLQY